MSGAALILLHSAFDLSPVLVGLLGASTFLGAMADLLVLGDTMDRWGRRAIFAATIARVAGSTAANAGLSTSPGNLDSAMAKT